MDNISETVLNLIKENGLIYIQTPKVPYPIEEKLREITKKVKKLDEVYEIYQKTNNKNIIIDDEDNILEEIFEGKTANNRKKVYKYNSDNILVKEYESLVDAGRDSGKNGGKDGKDTDLSRSIARIIATGKLYKNHYYKFE